MSTSAPCLIRHSFLLKVRVRDRRFLFRSMIRIQGQVSRSIWNSYKEISVGQVRGSLSGNVLKGIRQVCFEVEESLYPQAKRLMAHISLHYQGNDWVFVGEISESGAIRHRDTLKWYGVFYDHWLEKTRCWQVWENRSFECQVWSSSPFHPAEGDFIQLFIWIKILGEYPFRWEQLLDEDLFVLVDSSWQLTKRGNKMNLLRKLSWFFNLEKKRYLIGIGSLILVSFLKSHSSKNHGPCDRFDR